MDAMWAIPWTYPILELWAWNISKIDFRFSSISIDSLKNLSSGKVLVISDAISFLDRGSMLFTFSLSNK